MYKTQCKLAASPGKVFDLFALTSHVCIRKKLERLKMEPETMLAAPIRTRDELAVFSREFYSSIRMLSKYCSEIVPFATYHSNPFHLLEKVESCEPDLKPVYLEAAGALGSRVPHEARRIAHALEAFLAKEASPELKNSAVKALAFLGRPASILGIMRHSEKSPDLEFLSFRACMLLSSSLRESDQISVLSRFLFGNYGIAKWEAVRFIRLFETPEAWHALEEFVRITRQTDKEMNEALLSSLANLRKEFMRQPYSIWGPKADAAVDFSVRLEDAQGMVMDRIIREHIMDYLEPPEGAGHC